MMLTQRAIGRGRWGGCGIGFSMLEVVIVGSDWDL